MPLAKLALGIGLGAAAALAVKEARRFRAVGKDDAKADRGQADRLGLSPGEPAATGIERMTVAQLELAILALQSPSNGDVDWAVHETRKAIKRLRTLQRLHQDSYSRADTDHRRALLRKAAAELSGVRDSKVALDTLQDLMRRDPRRLEGSEGVAKLHSALLSEHDEAKRALTRSGARERALGLLQATNVKVAADAAADDLRMQARPKDGRAVDASLLRLYARGRRTMALARKREGIAEMHEWRKRTKDLRYAAEALSLQRYATEALSPQESPAKQQHQQAKQRRQAQKQLQARLRSVARNAEKLGEALGEEHDLALLAKRVRGEDETFRGDGAARKALLRDIKRRRRALRKQAFRAGFALYERKPKRWGKRMPRAR
jgi:hypothetical protein